MTKITAITSVYNAEKYLSGFLINAKKQKKVNFEIQMELNIPSENEFKIAKNFADENDFLKLSVSNVLNPMSKSWNNCINKANGDYICIWNVDDQRTSHSLKVMSRKLDKSKKIEVVFGDYYRVNSFGSKNGKLVDNSLNLVELNKGMIIGPFFMFRKSLVNRFGLFDEQLKTGADYDFAMRILDRNNITYIHKNLGYFLDEKKGSSTKPDTLQPLERTVIELRYNIKVTDTNLIEKAKKMYDIENLYYSGTKVPVKNLFNYKNSSITI